MLLLALLADIIREREFVKYFCLHNNSLSPYPWYYHSKCILFPLSLVGKHIRTHKQTSPYPEASLRTGKMCTMTGLQYIIQLDICIALSLVRVSSFVGVRSAKMLSFHNKIINEVILRSVLELNDVYLIGRWWCPQWNIAVVRPLRVRRAEVAHSDQICNFHIHVHIHA